ncbi:MAG: hypoxanthine phosphoribosyltransferase [Acidobacteria bacterium]|jgi:hypoxanthine phosphoribosyltransferase|nr:hypoxanthine phosphoribosyltransferase [Acidobacteriota bacterium]
MHVNEFISQQTLATRIQALGTEIRRDAGPDMPIHLVCVLKGAFMFLADLIRVVGGRVTCDFIVVKSYAGSSSTGQVQMLKDLSHPIDDRYVVLIEDIVDTGLTLAHLQDVFLTRKPSHLKTACLLSKPSRRKVEVPVDYVGFTIEDKFVVGYGLDFNEQYRNLPFIGVVEGAD